MRQLPLIVIVRRESTEIEIDNNYKCDACRGEEIGRRKSGGKCSSSATT